MGKLRVGLIGSGQIAWNSHIPNYKLLKEEVEIVALCDVNLELAKNIASKYGIQKAYSSKEEMLKEEQIDAVSICVPNKFHFESVMFALEHNCHVLCEKPPAMSYEEAKKMEDLAIKKGKILTYNFHFRHGKEFQYLKKQIENNEFGTIYSANVEYLRRRGIPGWGTFIDKEMQGGGPLIDVGVHMIDLTLYMMEYPKVSYVCATTHQEIGTREGVGLMGSWDHTKFTVEDSAFGFIKLENGASIRIATSFALNCKEKEKNTVDIYGAKAGASLFPLEIYGEEDKMLFDKTVPFNEDDDKHRNSIFNFVHACLGKEDIIVKAREGTILQNIIEKLYISAETNKPVMFE